MMARAVVIVLLLYAACLVCGVVVYIDSSVSDSEYNCTLTSNNLSHILCRDLTTALTNCNSSLTAYLKFVIVSERKFPIERSLTYEVVNYVSIQGNGQSVNCDGRSLHFVPGGLINQSSLTFNNISFSNCGSDTQIGIQISAINRVNINYVLFDSIFGVILQNVLNVTIMSATFQNSFVNPFAVLRIEYTSPMSAINEVSVVLLECNFTQNSYNDNYSSDNRKSGLLAISILNVASMCDFTFLMQKCYIMSNLLNFKNFPALLISNVSYSNVVVNINNLSYESNSIGLWIKTDNLDKSHVSLFLNQSIFDSNMIYLSDNKLLTVCTVNSYNSIITIYYHKVTFIKNCGILLQASAINGNVTHVLSECQFEENRETIAAQQTFVSFNGSGTNAVLRSISFANFSVLKSMPAGVPNNQSVISVTTANSLTIDNCNFFGHPTFIGTALSIDRVNEVIFTGLNNFSSNIGAYYGGGLYISGDLISLIITNNSVVTFYNNYAYYGGAMYIDTHDFDNMLRCNGTINFVHNVARLAGNSIYTTDTKIDLDHFKSCFNSVNNIDTAPSIFSFPPKINLFPGKIIRFANVTITDGLGKSSSCRATISLKCNGVVQLCEQTNSGLELKGPPNILLQAAQGKVNTLLYIKLNSSGNFKNEKATLIATCVDPHLSYDLQREIQIKWISNGSNFCPLGYVFQPESMICHCSKINSNGHRILCVDDYGIACIERNLWVGKSLNKTIIISCPYLLCSIINRQSNESTICKDYYGPYWVSLPPDELSQCAFNRAGRRCSQCRNDYHFTFGGINCTKQCESSYPYIVILIAILFQFVIFLFIIAAMRLHLDIGSGFMYGPLLFLAVVEQIQFGYYHDLAYLKIVVRLFASLFLENLEIIGEIPMCFMNSSFSIQLFYFFGPLLMWVMLFLLVGMGRCCPRILDRIQDSPMQAICLLMMLSFWSLANSSILLLRPLKIENELYSEVDPNVKYFHHYHIIIGLVAILVLGLMIIPFIALLAMSNFELPSRIFRLHRFKPIFDEFQSCYVDKHRWYCVVYYISFILFLIVAQYPLGQQLLLVLLLSLHFVVQPYKKHILNIIDMLLLLDLLFLCSVQEKKEELENGKKFYVVLTYILTLLPLLYILLGFIGILFSHFARRLKVKGKKFFFGSIQWRRQKTAVTTTQTNNDDQEREPLIRMIQSDDY